jgi:hypothetical protein
MWSISNESRGDCNLNVSSVESAPLNWNVALVVVNVQGKKRKIYIRFSRPKTKMAQVGARSDDRNRKRVNFMKI